MLQKALLPGKYIQGASAITPERVLDAILAADAMAMNRKAAGRIAN